MEMCKSVTGGTVTQKIYKGKFHALEAKREKRGGQRGNSFKSPTWIWGRRQKKVLRDEEVIPMDRRKTRDSTNPEKREGRKTEKKGPRNGLSG